MTTELRCECNDRWEIHYYNDYPYQLTTNTKCPHCGYWMWYDAYLEDMYKDLKEMNS